MNVYIVASFTQGQLRVGLPVPYVKNGLTIPVQELMARTMRLSLYVNFVIQNEINFMKEYV